VIKTSYPVAGKASRRYAYMIHQLFCNAYNACTGYYSLLQPLATRGELWKPSSAWRSGVVGAAMEE
jgi:hypothetical protein